MNGLKFSLCTSFIATLLLFSQSAIAAPPRPASAQGGGQAEGERFAVSVYTLVEKKRDGEPLTQSYAVFYARRGNRYAEINKLRIPHGVITGYRYTLETIDMGGGQTVLRFEAGPDSEDEADIIGLDIYQAYIEAQGPYTTIWSGSIDVLDPRRRLDIEDLDGDGDKELVLAQLDSAVAFCGSSKARLFPKVWDFKRDRFVDAPFPAELLNGAVDVTATMDDKAPRASHFPELVAFRSASSDARDINSNTRLSQPQALGDGQASTPWIEGAEGWGQGQFVTARINRSFAMRGMRLLPGNAASLERFAAYGVPTEVLLTFEGDNPPLRVTLPRTPLLEMLDGGGLYVEFPKPVISGCMSVTILEVRQPARKPKYQRTAFSELTPLVELDYGDRASALNALVDALASEETSRRRRELIDLASGFGQELGPAVERILNTAMNPDNPNAAAQMERVIPLLGALPRDEALGVLKQLLSYEALTRNQLLLLQKTIASQSKTLVGPLFDLCEASKPEDIVLQRAVRILGKAASPKQMVRLAPLLGQGDGELRRMVVRAMSRARFEGAETLLEIVETNPDSPAAHDALWALEHVTQRHLRGKTGTLPGGERILKAYNQSEDVQIRLRAIRLLTRITTSNADVFLITVLQSQERPEIRLIAAEALALYDNDKSTQALIGALTDTSPSVRFEAIKSLEDRQAQEAVVVAAVEYAKKETWKRGLSHAYRLIATSDHGPSIDYLYENLSGQDARRAGMAVTAISKARKNVRPEPLEAMVRDDNLDERMRQQAIQALAWADDAASESFLVEVLRNRVTYPENLQAASARAMGRRKTPQTLQALIDVLNTSGRAKVQRACIRALAHYPSRTALRALVGMRSKVDLRSRRYLEESIASVTKGLEDEAE